MIRRLASARGWTTFLAHSPDMRVKEIADALHAAGFVEENGTKHRKFYKNGIKVILPHGTTSAPWSVGALKSLLRRVERGKPSVRPHLELEQVRIGLRVASRVDFVDIPKGTHGIIEQDYGSGFTVRWELPHLLIPIRDGFDKSSELIFLEVAS
jgi:predicted RNA binding protein YcfA (HicA-like mRNA interferase family)